MCGTILLRGMIFTGNFTPFSDSVDENYLPFSGEGNVLRHSSSRETWVIMDGSSI